MHPPYIYIVYSPDDDATCPPDRCHRLLSSPLPFFFRVFRLYNARIWPTFLFIGFHGKMSRCRFPHPHLRALPRFLFSRLFLPALLSLFSTKPSNSPFVPPPLYCFSPPSPPPLYHPSTSSSSFFPFVSRVCLFFSFPSSSSSSLACSPQPVSPKSCFPE